MPALSDNTLSLWQNVVSAEKAIRASLRDFLVGNSAERLVLVRQALREPGGERAAAVRVLPYLTVAERMELFPDVVHLASWGHGMVQAARDAICALPREWVLSHIEAVVEPLLASSDEQGQFEEYRRFLELYQQLGDRNLIQRLAELSLQHPDEDVREAGAEFLAKNA
jgi:hypothetical protein